MPAEMFKIDLEPESQIWPGQPLAVCSNPGGRFHGWLFQQHLDGQWVSIRKLRPENHRNLTLGGCTDKVRERLMRNLVEYPVTPQEIVECLRRIRGEITVGDEGGCGSMDPVLLEMAADVVEAAAGMLEGIEERFRQHPKRGDWLAYATPWDKATALVRAFQSIKGE